MFSPLDWILPASRIRLDLMIACMFFFCLFLLDVFQAGLWSERLQPMTDKLKSLADSLPAFVLCSKATSSNVKYKNAWLNWKKWEKDNLGFNQFPVSPFLFCLYLREKVESCNSPAPIESAVYAVRWVHEIAGISSPTESSLVKQVLEASKRLLGKPHFNILLAILELDKFFERLLYFCQGL